MEDTFRILGDGLSIAALAIIFAVSNMTAKRIKPEAMVPLTFDRQGHPTQRVARNVGLWFLPVIALIVLFLPTVTGLTYEWVGEEAMMLFLLRAMVAAALAFRHITFMHRLIELMASEGQLRS